MASNPAPVRIPELVRAILRRAAADNYGRDGDPIKLVVGLDNGVVYRGHIVARTDWLELNTVAGKGRKYTANRESQETPGSWRENPDYAPGDDDDHNVVYMTMVEFLSGGQWVSGCSLACETDKIVIAGDQYF